MTTATTQKPIIERTRIIGTDLVIYSAWEPSWTAGVTRYQHHTISSLGRDEGQYGRIGTREIACSHWSYSYEAVGADGTRFDNDSLPEIRRVIKRRYGKAIILKEGWR